MVNAILDFTAFDEQVAESAGTDCAAAMRATTAAIEKLYFANDTAKFVNCCLIISRAPLYFAFK